MVVRRHASELHLCVSRRRQTDPIDGVKQADKSAIMTMEELRHVRLAGLMQGVASGAAHSRADRVPVADTMPSKLLGPVVAPTQFSGHGRLSTFEPPPRPPCLCSTRWAGHEAQGQPGALLIAHCAAPKEFHCYFHYVCQVVVYSQVRLTTLPTPSTNLQSSALTTCT